MTVPRGTPDFDAPRARPDEITATWIGQASWLLQLGGLNLLTDPVFSLRASPMSWSGPKRLSPPGIALADLPPIDAVLLSHDHYDHLDAPSVRALRDRCGDDLTWFVPLGFADWFARRGILRVVELDWWQDATLPLPGGGGSLRVTAAPAQHWCRRGPRDTARLWCSWTARVVADVPRADGRRPPGAVWFVGDSGYCPVFRDIGERLGPFDLSLVPIGAYEPRWFMKAAHMNPEEAVQAYVDVGGTGVFAGMHWGTFILTDEPVLEPPQRVRAAWSATGLPADDLWLPTHGETRRASSAPFVPGRRRFDTLRRERASLRMPATEVPSRHDALLDEFRAGRRTALARAISIVENERAGFEALLEAIHPSLGRAHRIGITGPPGAGKSTLTSALIALGRARGERIGVVAVDPTSPFTGGALLGDRIRMNDVALDDGVFIRSMATRGSLGGLALSTREVADVMDAFGFDRVIIETVGVGQSELDIAAAADSTVVVLVPESGDSIQAMKAGLMEAADLFVINKADRPGAQRLAKEVEMMIHFRTGKTMKRVPAHHGVDLKRVGRKNEGKEGKEPDLTSPHLTSGDAEGAAWTIPVLQTIAETGKDVDGLLAALDAHRAWLEASGELGERRRRRLAERVREVVRRRLMERVWREGGGERMLDEALPQLESGASTPYAIAARIVRAIPG
ncbi:MAG TPA: methylmalonyl Co-A mutase-associated GTPase MeaB [Longimicrobiales bacterium]|nr:methylmalonyl Co-A mutase-associated GTPase MeaB [Longimicrobiales bacterium]